VVETAIGCASKDPIENKNTRCSKCFISASCRLDVNVDKKVA
jgi:hypothetical protein